MGEKNKENQDALDRALQIISKINKYEERYCDDFIDVSFAQMDFHMHGARIYLLGKKLPKGRSLVFETAFGKVIVFRPGKWIDYLDAITSKQVDILTCEPIDDRKLFNGIL